MVLNEFRSRLLYGDVNVDKETNIHYGVINQNSLMPEALSDLFADEIDETFEECENTISEGVDELKASLSDIFYSDDMEEMAEEIKDILLNRLSDTYQCDESNYRYEKDGYIIMLWGSSYTMTVIKSPYYTLCRPCSLCYPNAGNLDSFDKEYGIKTYCLGSDFFEGEKAPYDIWEVD